MFTKYFSSDSTCIYLMLFYAFFSTLLAYKWQLVSTDFRLQLTSYGIRTHIKAEKGEYFQSVMPLPLGHGGWNSIRWV